MPVCCRCNGNGRCINCKCRKSGKACTNCLPLKKDQCKNRVSIPPTTSSINSSTQNTTSSTCMSQMSPNHAKNSTNHVSPSNLCNNSPFVSSTHSVSSDHCNNMSSANPTISSQCKSPKIVNSPDLLATESPDHPTLFTNNSCTSQIPHTLLSTHVENLTNHISPSNLCSSSPFISSTHTGSSNLCNLKIFSPNPTNFSDCKSPKSHCAISPNLFSPAFPTLSHHTHLESPINSPSNFTPHNCTSHNLHNLHSSQSSLHSIQSQDTTHNPAQLDLMSLSSNSDESAVEDLPDYEAMSAPNFSWGDLDGRAFCTSIDECYSEITRWKRNLFKIPSGKTGKFFTNELTRLLRAYADKSSLERIALKAAMVMPALLLQKPNAKSKAKDHVSLLERRLQLWVKGNLEELLFESRTIQHKLKKAIGTQKGKTKQLSSIFAKMMMQGRVRAALRLITEDYSTGPLSLDTKIDPKNPCSLTVKEELQKKHPARKDAKKSAILLPESPTINPHPILYDEIDGDLINRTVLKMDGVAGPSGLDAAAWKRLCNSFKSSSSDLRDALAAVTRRLCTSYVDPGGISALVACRLIALDKCPGVRPIGIGETMRRIIGKAIATTFREDIQRAAGPLQVCAGHIAGSEAAIHAMRQTLENPETDGTILVDATNAFNTLNREVALRNISYLCPSISKALVNTYREDIHLFIEGETLLSQEGTTQGDPLAMAMYAIATSPLIHRLKDKKIRQVWFADDATAGGNLNHLRSWWDNITTIGPDYGYLPNSAKTCLIVKDSKLEEANIIFKGTGLSITTEGKRHLGAALGTQSFVKEFVQLKVKNWVQELDRLSNIATTQPHAAYAALTHGLSNKWIYLARTTPDIGDLLQPLEDVIQQRFLPTITGQNPFSNVIRELMAMPVRSGGLGISNPTREARKHYDASKKIASPLTTLIMQQANEYEAGVISEQLKTKSEIRNVKRKEELELAATLKERLPKDWQRAMIVCSEKGASSWLSTLPIAEHGFALHKGAFRDAICLRYGWRPHLLPVKCICGKGFTVEHALSCPHGGYPSIRHNEIRDITAELMSEVCHGVGIEPGLQPVTGEQFKHKTANKEDGARLDIVAENFWSKDRQRAFFDVRVFNPFAQSHQNTNISQCYRGQEMEKRRQYEERIREVEHGSFSPLVFTSAGGMGPTANVVYKRLASCLAEKQEKQYSTIIHWIRCRLNFSLLRSAIMCLRGSRSTRHHPANPELITIANAECKIPLLDLD